MRNLQSDVRRIDGRLDRGFGTNYEAKVTQNARSILGQQAGVRNSRALKGQTLRTDPDLDRQVEIAEASGTITERESDELLLLDVIVSGNRAGTPKRVLLHLRGSQAFTISLLATSRQLSNGISAPAFSAGRWPSNAWCGRK